MDKFVSDFLRSNSITLCPPAVAAGSEVSRATKLSVAKQRRQFLKEHPLFHFRRPGWLILRRKGNFVWLAITDSITFVMVCQVLPDGRIKERSENGTTYYPSYKSFESAFTDSPFGF